MDENLNKAIDGFIAENTDAIFRDIARLVRVNSVEGPAEEGAPFGRGPAEALKTAFAICDELGLESRNCEDRIGYARLGKSEKYLATVTHLDVVPTGDGWSHDPFLMTERENYIIGRGVMDDKGPSVLCLYALKFLKEQNIPLKYEIRALLGINEETGMGDVEYYLKNYPAPAFCFSPDAEFPLCNGEKGITQGVIVSSSPAENILDIKGGFAYNAVPDRCEATVKADKLENAAHVTVEKQSDGVWHVMAEGIGGHASMPEGTRSAIGCMAHYLIDSGILSEAEEKFMSRLCLLYDDYTGKALGVDADDGLFKPATIIGGMIGLEDGHIYQTYDSRYPTNTSGAQIAAGISEKLAGTGRVDIKADMTPFYMSLDNPAVQVCINCYNEVTGENARPFTIGGGTYARDFPNAVSFGPEHPERPTPSWAGPVHGVDESVCKDWLLEALKVYIYALTELEKLDF